MIKEIMVDLTQYQTIGQVQDMIAEKLQFPDYYGRNLDALYDELTTYFEDIHFVIYGTGKESIWNQGFLQVLEDAEQENPHIKVEQHPERK